MARTGACQACSRKGEPASVNAERLDYQGGNGRAEYTGNATSGSG